MSDIWKQEDYKLKAHQDKETVSISAYDKTGKQVGRANFVCGPDYLEAEASDESGNVALFVWIEHRRKGLAEAMYNLAEEVTNMKIIPSEHRSGAGDQFWSARVANLPSGHPAHEWLGD